MKEEFEVCQWDDFRGRFHFREVEKLLIRFGERFTIELHAVNSPEKLEKGNVKCAIVDFCQVPQRRQGAKH